MGINTYVTEDGIDVQFRKVGRKENKLTLNLPIAWCRRHGINADSEVAVFFISNALLIIKKDGGTVRRYGYKS